MGDGESPKMYCLHVCAVLGAHTRVCGAQVDWGYLGCIASRCLRVGVVPLDGLVCMGPKQTASVWSA